MARLALALLLLASSTLSALATSLDERSDAQAFGAPVLPFASTGRVKRRDAAVDAEIRMWDLERRQVTVTVTPTSSRPSGTDTVFATATTTVTPSPSTTTVTQGGGGGGQGTVTVTQGQGGQGTVTVTAGQGGGQGGTATVVTTLGGASVGVTTVTVVGHASRSRSFGWTPFDLASAAGLLLATVGAAAGGAWLLV